MLSLFEGTFFFIYLGNISLLKYFFVIKKCPLKSIVLTSTPFIVSVAAF